MMKEPDNIDTKAQDTPYIPEDFDTFDDFIELTDEQVGGGVEIIDEMPFFDVERDVARDRDVEDDGGEYDIEGGEGYDGAAAVLTEKRRGIFAALIPRKGDKKSEVARKSVFLVSLVTALVCVVLIIVDWSSTSEDDKRNAVLREIKENSVLNLIGSDTSSSGETVANTGDGGILPQWEELYGINSDLVGWVKIDGTVIDYPVVQDYWYEEDEDGVETLKGSNERYLHIDFDGNYSSNGTVFVDWHTPVVSGRRPDNIVLYGHNIASGIYFAYVSHYNNKAFGMSAIVNHPTVEFETVYDNGRNTYKIFAGIYVNTLEEHGEVFHYYRNRRFDTEESFYNFIGELMDRSTFYTDVDIEYGDEILTLSTCYYPDGIDTRYAIFARRVRDGEDPSVDTDKAVSNPDPKYFDYYYRVMGGEWGGRNWDTSKVKGFDEFYASLDQ